MAVRALCLRLDQPESPASCEISPVTLVRRASTLKRKDSR